MKYLGEHWQQRLCESVDMHICLGARHLRCNFYQQQQKPAVALRLLPAHSPTPQSVGLPEALLA